MTAVKVATKSEGERPVTMQVIKNKAEQGLIEAFERTGAALPGGAEVSALRREAIGRFASAGLPHRRVEEWKYTDLRNAIKEAYPPVRDAAGAEMLVRDALQGKTPGLLPGLDAYTIVLVNGAVAESALPEGLAGVECHALSAALGAGTDWVVAAVRQSGAGEDGVQALNTAFMSGGIALRIAPGTEIAKPIHLVYLSPGDGSRAVTLRNVISVGAGAAVTIVESYPAAPGVQANTVTQLTAGDGARVAHLESLDVAEGAVHLSSWLVRLGADAVYKPFQFVRGQGLARLGLALRFEGQHSSLDFSALTLGEGPSHADTALVIDHAVPHCTSRELYKCVLDGRARGVFQGKVIVRPDAQKTDGKQMAQALMLSPDAEFDSKPELEIYADDVICGHGSTSAELDDDLLFYCRSRGIPLAEARALLIESFIGETIDKVEHEALRDGFTAIAQGWLRAGHI